MLESASPVGSAGLEAQEVTVPPAFAGVLDAIAVPLVKVYGLPLYEIDGGGSFTAMLTVVLPLPPVLVAVMVYVAAAVTAVGVPEIAHRLESERPVGSAGETAHETIGPPELAGVTVVIVVLVEYTNGVPA